MSECPLPPLPHYMPSFQKKYFHKNIANSGIDFFNFGNEDKSLNFVIVIENNLLDLIRCHCKNLQFFWIFELQCMFVKIASWHLAFLCRVLNSSKHSFIYLKVQNIVKEILGTQKCFYMKYL